MVVDWTQNSKNVIMLCVSTFHFIETKRRGVVDSTSVFHFFGGEADGLVGDFLLLCSNLTK